MTTIEQPNYELLWREGISAQLEKLSAAQQETAISLERTRAGLDAMEKRIALHEQQDNERATVWRGNWQTVLMAIGVTVSLILTIADHIILH